MSSMSTETTIVNETEATSELIEQAVASIALNADTSQTAAKKKKKKNKKKAKTNGEVVAVPQQSPETDDKENSVVQVVQELVVVEEPQQQVVAVAGDNALVAQPADNFDNLQKAVQILGKAKMLDEGKKFDEALKLYRQGVDMLIEELIGRQGTDQSRLYLRNKCNDFMNRIDQLKQLIRLENAAKENAAAIDALT